MASPRGQAGSGNRPRKAELSGAIGRRTGCAKRRATGTLRWVRESSAGSSGDSTKADGVSRMPVERPSWRWFDGAIRAMRTREVGL